MKHQRLFILSALIGMSFLQTVRAAIYHVGLGQPLTNINDIAMHELVAGDTVHIHWRAEPYREKFRLSGVGTAAQPIHVLGVPGPNGERPVIDAENATTHPTDYWPVYGNNQSTGDTGPIIVRRGPNRPYTEKPSHIIIEGLEVTHARDLYGFTDSNGLPRTWMGSGIWIMGADDVSIINCKVHDCSNGIFAKSGSDEPDATRRLTIRNCHIENCSENLQQSGHTFASHNIYTECLGILFEGNYLGPIRPGADGANLKDRSSGTVVRYNWIEGGTRVVDLVEAQDSIGMVQSDISNGDLSYFTTQVYGNYIYCGPGDATRPIHYGGDSGMEANYRKGTLYFHHNTVVMRRDLSEAYRVSIFDLETDDETAEIINNVFHVESFTPGEQASFFYFADLYGHHNFGTNWVTDTWGTWDNGQSPAAQGTFNGSANFVVGSDPGFQGITQKDLRPGAYSPLLNAGQQLPVQADQPAEQYVFHGAVEPRTIAGNPDLGAHEFVPPAGPVAPVAHPQSITGVQNQSLSIVLGGYDDNGDSLSFALSTLPQHGTLAGTAPNLTYTPDVGYLGMDGFTFVAHDGALNSDPATVSLLIEPPRYELTVQGGTGSGDYLEGEVVTLTANTAPQGEAFTGWVGATVMDPDSPTTTLTMPASGITVGALFRPLPPPGGPFTYDVGPGQTYTNLSSVPWKQLFPGDSVRLHWRSEPYNEKVLIPARGSASDPIRFVGVAGPNGERPVISGAGALTPADLGFASWDVAQYLGMITVSRANTDSAFFKPGFIEIEGLEIRDIKATQGVWYEGAAGIRIAGSENVTVRNCHIHDVCTGLDARMSYGCEFGLNRNILVEGCHISYPGTPGQYGNANIRSSAIGMTIRFCRLDAPLSGSYGDNVLDRSAGTVIEACRIEGAARMLVLVEPTGSGASIIREDSSFTTTRIAGNLMLVTNPYASHPIFVGGDSSGPEYARYGDLELHHNTIVINSGTWRVNLPTVLSNVSVDFRNNIVWRQGSEIIRLMGGAGILNSGANWISPGWESGPDALFSGVASILPETINDPLLDSDFVPLEGSPARDSGGNALVNFQYHETASGSLRPVVCSGSDLGAFEAGSHSPNLEPILDGKVFSGGFAIWLNGNPNTGYLIEWSDDFVNWQTLGAGTTDEKGTLLMVDPSHPITTHRFYRAQ